MSSDSGQSKCREGERVIVPRRAKEEVQKDELEQWRQARGDRQFSRRREAQRA